MHQNSLEFKWNKWVLRARDILGTENVDLLCLSYLNDTSVYLSCNNKLLAIADRNKRKDDLSSLLWSTWWKDKKFRDNFLWCISQLGEEGALCVQHLSEFELEFDCSHTFSGASQESELCGSIFRVLLNLSGRQRKHLKARLAGLRPINTEHVNSYTHLFKMMFNGRLISTVDLTALGDALREVEAPTKATKHVEEYCVKYGLPFQQYERPEVKTAEQRHYTGLATNGTQCSTGARAHECQDQQLIAPVDDHGAPQDPTADIHIHVPTRCTRRAKTYCCCTIPLWIVLILLAVVSLGVFSKYPRNKEGTFLAVAGDVLLLDEANEVLYKSWDVTDIQLAGDYPNSIELFSVPCNDIVTHNFEGHNSTSDHYLYESTRSLAHLDYLYLLAGSRVVYDICLWANKSTPSAELFAFDSVTDYQEFVDEESSGTNSVAHYELDIGTVGSPICTHVQFTASKASYYFLTASCSAGVSYHFNITSHVKYLNQTDYKDYSSCTIEDSGSCSLDLDTSIFPKLKESCLIASSAKLPMAHQTMHIKVSTQRRCSMLAVPGCALLVLMLGLVVYLVILKPWRKCRALVYAYGYEYIGQH